MMIVFSSGHIGRESYLTIAGHLPQWGSNRSHRKLGTRIPVQIQVSRYGPQVTGLLSDPKRTNQRFLMRKEGFVHGPRVLIHILQIAEQSPVDAISSYLAVPLEKRCSTIKQL